MDENRIQPTPEVAEAMKKAHQQTISNNGKQKEENKEPVKIRASVLFLLPSGELRTLTLKQFVDQIASKDEFEVIDIGQDYMPTLIKDSAKSIEMDEIATAVAGRVIQNLAEANARAAQLKKAEMEGKDGPGKLNEVPEVQDE
jgi:ABC-type hemin transport system substrate-binding protein